MVFVLYYPLLDDGAELHYRDITNVKTIATCGRQTKSCLVVARVRSVAQNPPWTKVTQLTAKLGFVLPDYGVGGPRGWFNLIRYLSPFLWVRFGRILRRADLVYVEAPSLEAYLVTWLLAFTKIPVVMEMRAEMVLNNAYMRTRFGWRGLVYRRVLRLMFGRVRKRASAGLYINRYCLERYPVDGTLMEAICDADLPQTLFEVAGRVDRSGQRLLYVGNLEKVKRVDLILAALAAASAQLSPTWQLDLVGDGPETNNLKALAGRLGIARRIVFNGRIAWGAALFKYYKDCDTMLIASCSETGPRVLLEAMAAGMPVISTRVGMAEELLDDDSLVAIDDLDMIKNRIVRFMTDEELLRRQSAKNRNSMLRFIRNDPANRRSVFWRRAMQLVSHTAK